MRNLISSILARFGYVKGGAPAPVEVNLPVDLTCSVEEGFFTVVLDWAEDGLREPIVEHVQAANYLSAIDVAMEAAWGLYMGLVSGIPEGAEYDQEEAREIWYSPSVFHGLAVPVRG
ncbi:hypothetical protein ACIOJE_07795 [Kitasatospora sp. NPDC087861]|uniref:hypothetical protein n=1 Tax=Kitasatospora sp. NPDC087861 TaxID=3364070 RepID=UPI00381C508C